MFHLGRMVFPRAEPEGKPSSLGETFHHVTPTGMAYLYNNTTDESSVDSLSVTFSLDQFNTVYSNRNAYNMITKCRDVRVEG